MSGCSGHRLNFTLLATGLMLAACSDRTGPAGGDGGGGESEPLKFISLVPNPYIPVTCGIAADSIPYCWGTNFNGELGTPVSTTCPFTVGGPIPCAKRPVPVANTPKLTSLSAGSGYFCGLSIAGSAYCWGHIIVDVDQGFPLGATPTLLPGGLTLIQISTGVHHICGVTTNAEIACWGDYNGGVRGDPNADPDTAQSSFTPNIVAGGLSFKAVMATASSSCGLTTAGAAYCWGSAFMGGLGNPAAATQTNCGFAWAPCATQPVAVAGGLTFRSLAAGWFHYCALDSMSGIYCWGLGSDGQLGVSPQALAVCNQAGYGAAACSLSPVAVSAPSGLAMLSAGGLTTCGVDSLGFATCWGSNDFGQLGTGGGGGSPYRPIPAKFYFRSISAGRYHSCGLTEDSLAYCWGDNDAGELGTGDTKDANLPVAVIGPGSP
jgi:alpha-tubulin suppressor-like RCC1 family protein